MFQFKIGKQKKQEQSVQNQPVFPPLYSDATPTADELFERTMAPTLRPKDFMEQQNSFTEPSMVNEGQAPYLGQTEPLKHCGGPDITAWQSQNQENVKTSTEKISKPAFSEEDLKKATEQPGNKRILRFVGNNGGPIFYHSRMEEK